MKTHIVKQGDHIERIAFRYRVSPEVIWNHDANRALRDARESMHVLAPGDVVHLPDATALRHSVRAGESHAFTAHVPTVQVSLAISAHNGSALVSRDYEARAAGWTRTGTTDGDGVATIDVPIELEEFVLAFAADRVSLHVKVGHMDPLSTRSGVRKRLSNLGYALPEQGELDSDEALREALEAFQRANDLTVSGELDEGTRAALQKLHSY